MLEAVGLAMNPWRATVVHSAGYKAEVTVRDTDGEECVELIVTREGDDVLADVCVAVPSVRDRLYGALEEFRFAVDDGMLILWCLMVRMDPGCVIVDLGGETLCVVMLPGGRAP
jgi:hypothetical protein